MNSCYRCGADVPKTQIFCEVCMSQYVENKSTCVYCPTARKGSIREIGAVKTFICKTCADRITFCSECGVLSPHTTGIYAYEGGHLCRDCMRDKNLKLCGHCHELHGAEKFTKAPPDNIICDKCFESLFTCAGCNRLRTKKQSTFEYNGKLYCEPCKEAYFNSCMYCGTAGMFLDLTQVGEYVCKSCRREHGLWRIDQYNHVPREFSFHGEGPLFYGIENEISVGDKRGYDHIAEHISRNFDTDQVYMVQDGTVYSGFELVAHPFSFKEMYNQNFEKMFHKDMVVHHSCGMHVHMSKEAFTSTHLYKFISFFNKNNNFIVFIAERDYATIVDYRNPGRSMCKKTEATTIREKAEAMYYPDKYFDINLKPKNTVEIRVFQGVIEVGKLYKNIEFLECLFNFTKNRSRSNLGQFLSYIDSHKETYPNLSAAVQEYDPEIDYVSRYKPKPTKPSLKRATIATYTAPEAIPDWTGPRDPLGGGNRNIQVGSEVRLMLGINFTFGRGSVQDDEIGVVTSVRGSGHVTIDFPSCRGWNGFIWEVALV